MVMSYLKKLLIITLLIITSLHVYAQNNNNQLKCECTNGDFESGTFANWQGELGWCCPISTNPSGIVPGRHTIMSGSGVDPFTCGGLKVVAPGGNFSARLGNANVGAEAEKLKYSFVVDSTKWLFLYKYAVVLEDPGHPANAQPYMNLNIKVNGQSVGYCGTESFTAGGNLAGKFKNCGPYQWKDWETVGYDLEPYDGQNVTIEFATGDCAYGGHFGYGYIDAFCTPKKLKNTFCANSSSKTTTLEAPEGFNYLWMPGGMTTQKVTISNPQPGVTYTCTMSSKLKPSCKTYMTAKMDTAGIQAYFTNSPCSNKVVFKDSIVTPKGTWITNTKWDFGDGTVVSNKKNPEHSFPGPGQYNVSLIVTNNNGCIDTIGIKVNLEPPPKLAIGSNSTMSMSEANPFSDGLPDGILPSKIYQNTDSNYVICVNTNLQFKDATTLPNSSGKIVSWNWNFGDGDSSVIQNPSHLYATTGIYDLRFIAKTTFGCEDTLKRKVIVLPKPKPNFTTSNVCLNQAIAITNTSTIDTGYIKTFKWQFGDGTVSLDTTPTYQYASPGTYNVKLTTISEFGCMDSMVNSITIHPIPKADFNASNVCLSNQNIFTNTSTIFSGTITNYNWDLGDSTTSNQKDITHTYETEGTYTIKLSLTSDNACTDSITKQITVHPKAEPDFNYTTVCETESTVFMDLSKVSNGNIVNWNWNFGDGSTSNSKSPIHTFATAGNYNVSLSVVTDKGCAGTITKLVTVNPLPKINFATKDVCLNDTMKFVANNITNTNISKWNWNFGDGNTSIIKNAVNLYKSYGTFLVTLIGTNVFGCTDTIQQNVNIYPLPSVAFTTTAECLGNETKFQNFSTVPNGNLTFVWDFGDGSSSTLTNTEHLYKSDGIHNATLIATTDKGCKDTLTKNVTIHPIPVADFTFNNVCNKTPVQFTDNSTIKTGTISNWKWNLPSSIKNPTYTFPKDSMYDITLIVNSQYGCKDTVTKYITIYPLPISNFSSDSVCLNNQTIFTNLSNVKYGALNYSWKLGDGNSSNVQNTVHTYSSAGNYNVQLIVVSEFGCRDSITKQTVVHPLPISKFTTTEVCLNFPSKFTNQSSISSGTIESFIWHFGNGVYANSKDTEHTYDLCGSYNASLIAVSNFNCMDTIFEEVVVNCLPISEFVYENKCLYDTSKFIDKSKGVITSWSWEFGDTGVSDLQNPNHIYDAYGNYTVQLIVTTDKGCKDTTINETTIYSLPYANFSTAAVCKGLATEYIDQSTYIDNSKIIEWVWDFGDGKGYSTNKNATYVYSTDGDFTTNLLVKNIYGCTDTTNKSVTVHPIPVADFGDTLSSCFPLEANFIDLSTIKKGFISDWHWDFGDGNYSSQQNPTHVYTTNPPYVVKYDVSLYVTSDMGCSHDSTKYKIITVYPLPIAEFTMFPNPTSIIAPKVTFTDESLGNQEVIFWNWDFGDGLYNTIQNPQHIYQEPGLYVVKLIVENQYGCQDTVYKTVTIQPDFTFYIPNSFTPDGNGINDVFYGYGIGVQSFSMNIFDRWGNNLFNSDDLSEGWDGRANGGSDIAQQDVYVYVVKLIDVFGIEHKYIGHVNLIK